MLNDQRPDVIVSTDPDMAELEQAAATSPAGHTRLERLRAKLEQAKAKPVDRVTFILTRLPEIEVTYRLPATAKEVDQIATNAKPKAKADPMRFSRMLLARCCVGIAISGEAQLEDNGTPMTWSSPAIRDLFDAEGSTDALTAAYRGGVPDGPGDGEIDQHASDLLERAGFGDDTQRWVAENPTTA